MISNNLIGLIVRKTVCQNVLVYAIEIQLILSAVLVYAIFANSIIDTAVINVNTHYLKIAPDSPTEPRIGAF